MRTVCKLNKCVGCYACVDLCPKKAIKIVDNLASLNAVIEERDCVGCGICVNVCQINHPLQIIKPIQWYQGWSLDNSVRMESSSGGAAAEISNAVISLGGVVCSCVFDDGKFCFEVVDCVDKLKRFSGSKYVKSNLEGVHIAIRKMLNENKEVLFIGLPCQCASLKKTIENTRKGTLYLVDLICHGTPSVKLLEQFLEQYQLSLSDFHDISFRVKDRFSIKGNKESIVTPGTMDCYSIAFMNCLSYTENCYECRYADNYRVSDITIGDSWGTNIATEASKGISLILCNTPRGEALLKKTNMHLEEVDINRAILANPQLSRPSLKPDSRAIFFDGIDKGKKFNSLVRKCLPKKWFRQFMKRCLIRLHIIKGGV